MNCTLPASSCTLGAVGLSASAGSGLTSVIVTVTAASSSVAFTGFVRRTVKSSASSSSPSVRIATVKVFTVSPAAKVSVPDAAV